MDDDELLRAAEAEINRREPIFVIESPSPGDLYVGRHEGDALVRTLGLAQIEVSYYLVTNAETFDRAFDDIAQAIKIKKDPSLFPFIHISAHGDEDGIVLTDDDIIFWDKLSASFSKLHKSVGHVSELEPILKDVPRTSLCLSSCSTFTHFARNLPAKVPFQCMIGPTEDVGWCQSLLGFSTFYYQAFERRSSYFGALEAMNAASCTVETPIFKILAPYAPKHALKALREDALRHLRTRKRAKGEANK